MQEDYIDDSGRSGPTPGFAELVGAALKWGGALLSVALIAGTVVWSYRLGTQDIREIPVVRAMQDPMRSQPAEPGGTQAAHQGLEVNDILAGSDAGLPTAAVSAPGPVELTAEDVPANTESTPVAGAAPEPTQEQIAVDALLAGGETVDPAEAGASPGDEITVQEQAEQTVDDLIAQAMAEASGQPTGPEVRPRLRPSDAETQAETQPRSGGIASTDEVKPGARVAQLGAYDSEALAISVWDTLMSAHGDLLGPKKRFIESATLGGKIFFRLRVVGFENLDQTRAFCSALEARDVDCIPVVVR